MGNALAGVREVVMNHRILHHKEEQGVALEQAFIEVGEIAQAKKPSRKLRRILNGTLHNPEPLKEKIFRCVRHWIPGGRLDMVTDLIDDVVDSLRFVHSKLPGRVAAAYLKTVTNGWCTPSRF